MKTFQLFSDEFSFMWEVQVLPLAIGIENVIKNEELSLCQISSFTN